MSKEFYTPAAHPLVIDDTTEFYLDKYGLVLSSKNTTDKGMGDCVGRTFLAYMAYGSSIGLYGINNCYDIDTGKLIRHPDLAHIDDMSRDHVIYFILANAAVNNVPILGSFNKLMKWRISERYTYTIDSWAWVKYVCNKKYTLLYNNGLNKAKAAEYKRNAFLWQQLYYWVTIPTMFFNVLWNKTISFIGGFKEVPQSEWVKGGFKKLPTWRKKLAKMLYPTYALHQKAWQLQCMPKTPGFYILRQLCRWLTTKHNYLIKLLLDSTVTFNEIDSYKPMTSYRWSCNLDNTNDRDMDIIAYTVNNIDKDLLNRIYKYKTYEL
jgi:hypothetical protein